MNEVSERNIKAFHQDMDSLGIMRPDRMPRATKCLDGIRSFIEELEKKELAYEIEGDVYFAVTKNPNYGKLSGRDLESQQTNADGRIEDKEEARKKNPLDFALWKGTKPGETSYPSKWGNGRPGWHIECSAMVRKELGDTIDIHLGGADLIFPHHENEIAQSESVTEKNLANFWLHNGMVNVDGQKMSKSLGNFTTIRALIKSKISPMTLRLFVLQAHYRKPLDFTNNALNAASTGWKGLNIALCLGTQYRHLLGWGEYQTRNGVEIKALNLSNNEELNILRQRFIEAMDDDMNTSGALAVLFLIARPLRALSNRLERDDIPSNLSREKSALHTRWLLLIELAKVLGLKYEPSEALAAKHDSILETDKTIQAAINARKNAKSARNFKEADRIRDELKEMGIELIDKPGGITEWIRIST